MLLILGTRTTPIDNTELLNVSVPGATVTAFNLDDFPDTGLDVFRDDAKVSVSFTPVKERDLWGLPPAAAAAVRASKAPCVAILDQGNLELGRDVAVAFARLLRGAVWDRNGYLGSVGRAWPPDEAAQRPVGKPPERVNGQDRTCVFILPTQPQEDLACWGELTRQLPAALEVVPADGGALTGPDDVLLGIASVVRDNTAVRVEVRDPGDLGLLLPHGKPEDAALNQTVRRAAAHGAPIFAVWWGRDAPGAEAVAWGLVALLMERWGGVAGYYPSAGPPPYTLPASADAARAESRRLDPDLDWTPAPPPPPPSVRWASTGGVVFDEPMVIPRQSFNGEPPKAVFVARIRVFPTRHVLFTTEGLTEALGVVVKHGKLGPTHDDVPWIATLSRGSQGVLFIQSRFPFPTHELAYATFDDATRARVQHLRDTVEPLSRGPAILEVHVDLVDPLDVAIAREIAAHLAELTEGVVAADHPMLLPRAGRTYTAAELRGLVEVGD